MQEFMVQLEVATTGILGLAAWMPIKDNMFRYDCSLESEKNSVK
jgi:hypothetical protein